MAHRPNCTGSRARWLAGAVLLLSVGCDAQTPKLEMGGSISAYRDRMLVAAHEQPGDQAARPAPRADFAVPADPQADLPQKAALLAGPTDAELPPPEAILEAVPDPADAPAVLRKRLDLLRTAERPDMRLITNFTGVVESAMDYLRQVERPVKFRLSLAEAIQRTLANSYRIRFESYNPAISQAQIVEAEAAFDAEFFLDSTWSQRDQPTFSELQTSESDTRTLAGGFRKLLPTGMQVSTSLSWQRQVSNFQFQTINPAYANSFIVEFTQPLLRGFGLEYNRAQINISKAQTAISYEDFLQQVRATLFEVETIYWRLLQARRTASILAEAVAQNYVTFRSLEQRAGHDVTPIELANAESRWRSRQVEYQEAIRNLRDIEDQLKNQLNDPELLLSRDIEVVPTTIPFVSGLTLDQLAAVRTALEERNEIHRARYQIEQARISTYVAKNETLPRFDLGFQYEVQGIGNTTDNSFDNLTTNRFISYAVSATFSYPLGNRGPQARYRQRRLQEAQAVVALHRITDTIVEEVNRSVRALVVRYAQIPPQLEAVDAAERNLRALQARTQRIDPLYLENELNAVERLTQARTILLQVIAEYNIAIAALEASKGTLLEYNNVVVTDQPAELPESLIPARTGPPRPR